MAIHRELANGIGGQDTDRIGALICFAKRLEGRLLTSPSLSIAGWLAGQLAATDFRSIPFVFTTRPAIPKAHSMKTKRTSFTNPSFTCPTAPWYHWRLCI